MGPITNDKCSRKGNPEGGTGRRGDHVMMEAKTRVTQESKKDPFLEPPERTYMALLTPSLQASGLRNCDGINAYCFNSHTFLVICHSSPG